MQNTKPQSELRFCSFLLSYKRAHHSQFGKLHYSSFFTLLRKDTRPNYIKIEGTKNSRAVCWVKVSPKIVELVRSLPGEMFDFDLKRFRERLQRFCKDLGIDYEVTTYTLRHTFATNLYILGIPEKDRQAMMGHAGGSRITNDVYTTYSPDVTAAEIREIYGDFLPEF